MQKYFNAYLKNTMEKLYWNSRRYKLEKKKEYINLVGTVARIETYCMGFIAKTSAKNGQRGINTKLQ